MKQKLMYAASVAVVISSSVFALMQVDDSTLMPSSSKLMSKNEMVFENDSVSANIKKLKKKYPHIKHPCLYASAMVMDNQADKIPTLLETETKCIHTLVIAEGQEKHASQQVAK